MKSFILKNAVKFGIVFEKKRKTIILNNAEYYKWIFII